ncbi:MAG: hypothetical protein HY293_06620 [Planctomycetes bacterium]|nr:hypothetical protein [Planctomycetota bacterium]
MTSTFFLLALAFVQADKKPTDDPATWRWVVPDPPAIAGMEHGTLHSAAMDLDVGYNVFLPPGYKESTEKFPAAYFLHGMTGTERSDSGFAGMVLQAIREKKIPPMIYVFPNGGYSSWYLDWAGGKVMVETMIVKELIPLIDRTYRTLGSREGRAVCGFSMGGYGAFHLAFKYPELFCSAASIGGALGNADRTIDFRRARGTPMESVYRDGCPWKLAAGNAEKIKGRVAMRLYVGDKDGTFKSHGPFVDHLKGLGLAPDLRVFEDVEHNHGQYFPKMAADLLEFQAQAFR